MTKIIVFQNLNADDKVELVSKSGGSIMKLGKFVSNKVSQGYSKVKERTMSLKDLNIFHQDKCLTWFSSRCWEVNKSIGNKIY